MRCKACNKIMEETEIIWREDIQEHEPLCVHCKEASREGESKSVFDLIPDESIEDIINILKS